MTYINLYLPSWPSKPVARFIASALTGVFLFECFPLLDWHDLVWIALLPLLIALVTETRRLRGFWLGYLAGAVFLTGSCYWFVDVMEGYGGLALPVSIGVLALFVIVFSSFYGVFGLVETAMARQSKEAALFLSPFLWVGMELARTYLITGFPWNLLGYAVRPEGLEQVASVTAVYGLSFAAVATSALVAWVFLRPHRKIAWIALSFWVGALVLGNRLLLPPPVKPEPHVAVLVQPDIPLGDATVKNYIPWLNPEPFKNLVQSSVAATRKAENGVKEPPLLIWPENPAPFYFNRDPIFREAVQFMAMRTGAYVVTGTVTFGGEGSSEPKNSAVVLAPDGRLLLQYDKIHLVPFGEYVPWWAFPGKVGKITSQVGDFVAGSSIRVARTPEGTIGVFICYEAIFPQLVRKFAAAGAGVLVNISDDAWFGDSPASFQHLQMARFRAIENGRFLLRATNNGITTIIDPYGRLLEEIPRKQAGILTGNFQYLSGETFYTRHGDVFAWFCVAAALALVLAFVWRSTPWCEPDRANPNWSSRKENL